VTYDGIVKLLDFGIAKANDRLAKTATGILKGKLPYMSPEQVRSGGLCDARSDQFSLCVVLWELTTGKPLFQNPADDYEVMKAIVESGPPKPSSVCRDYPAKLECIVMTGLRKERGERYRNVSELQRALEEFSVSQGLALSTFALAKYMKGLFLDA